MRIIHSIDKVVQCKLVVLFLCSKLFFPSCSLISFLLNVLMEFIFSIEKSSCEVRMLLFLVLYIKKLNSFYNLGHRSVYLINLLNFVVYCFFLYSSSRGYISFRSFSKTQCKLTSIVEQQWKQKSNETNPNKKFIAKNGTLWDSPLLLSAPACIQY